MNLKRMITLGTIFIFLISFITHNMYEWVPSFVTFILFPINETIFEHLKMIYISYLLWGIVEFVINKIYSLNIKNVALYTVISYLFNVVIFLIIYLPIDKLFGHNLYVTLFIYLITIYFSQILNYKLIKQNKEFSKLNLLSFFVIILIQIIFAFFSYNPPKI